MSRPGVWERLRSALRGFRMKPGESAGWTDAWLRGNEALLRSPITSYFSGPDQAMQVSAVQACVRLISENVAKLPIHVFRMIGDSDRERYRQSPVEGLLNDRPNDWQTANEFRKQLTAHVCLHGNGFALKQREGGRVSALIPWHPTRVRVTQDADGLAPVYELRPLKGGATTRVPASDMLHLRDLTFDGVLGMSRLEQASQGISLAVAAETYAAAYFANGAEPGIALVYDKMLDPEKQRTILEGWRASHGGPHRAHTPALVQGGLKIERMGSTNKDSQLLELRAYQIEDIARLYGVPPHMIGQGEKQTSWGTGVEQWFIAFMQFNLMGWTVIWDTAIKRDLLAEDAAYDAGLFAEHTIEGFLRADIQTRMDSYAVAITNGIMSRNEVRQRENLPPYPGGERFLAPLNMAPADGAPVAPPANPQARLFAADRPRSAWRKASKRLQNVVREREVTP